jgi:hypothetical protein
VSERCKWVSRKERMKWKDGEKVKGDVYKGGKGGATRAWRATDVWEGQRVDGDNEGGDGDRGC